MPLALFKVSVLFLCSRGFIEATSSGVPRMIFADEARRLPVPGRDAPARILLDAQPDTVTAVGRRSLISFDFQDAATTPVEREVLLGECQGEECSYNITVVHRTTEANRLFVCGAAGEGTFCCDVNLSDTTPMCVSSHKAEPIESTIRGFTIMEGEPSALVESGEKADLYVTYSGSREHVGIHKFGKHRVGPANHDKEQYYVGLMPVSRGDGENQDKVYAFYKERNKDTSLDSEMWLPFVTRVCMADLGGPKNNLQFSWTSQMNARLFCGDPDRRRRFSELVHVATVRAERWQESRVYALFRNEWGMSAVCVYSMQDIEHVFATSPLKGNSGSHKDRERGCVADSRKILSEDLRIIEKTSEMEQWVRPESSSAPLLLNHHNYTRIHADSSDHTVLFLSLHSGAIHKVTHSTSPSIVIAEYQPLNHRALVTGLAFHSPSRKLYVNTGSEVVQLDVANCNRYGDRCEDCVLARDPYCGWDGAHCTPMTQGSLQDVTEGNHAICPQPLGKASRYSTRIHEDNTEDNIMLPAESKYFLHCPVSSHHAQYSWHHGDSSTSCNLNMEQCLFLIRSMDDKHEGTYKCVSEEKGFRKVLAEHKLQIENGAVGPLSSPLVWLCLMAVLIRSL